jgi:hypothetical protein
VAGAIAGMAFAVLFSISMVLMNETVSDLANDRGAWMLQGAGRFSFAVGLMPFAGIFFLWFVAVVRERLGEAEDKFFATVFLGSGLLFLAMMFCASAVAGAIGAGYARSGRAFAGGTVFLFSRDLVRQVFGIYALRMAAIFVLSQATLWLLTGVMPRWIAAIGYGAGFIMLLGVFDANWTVLILPAWVFLVSLYILIVNLRTPQLVDGRTQDLN